MFREMRRKKQMISLEKSEKILERATSGVLAVDGDDGYPYAVPLSFVYDKDCSKIYFHSAKSGHKLDAIRRNEKASFCIIDQDDVIPEKYTTYFRSLIVFGKIRILEREDEIRSAIERLVIKYAPNETEQRQKEVIEAESGSMCMIELQIEHMTGKEAIELVQKGDIK